MENQLQNQTTISKSVCAQTTIRYLSIKSIEFNEFLQGYEQWLRVLGYSSSTVYYFPGYLRSFLNFLENKGIQCLVKVKSSHIRQYISSLSQRANIKTGQPLSKNYRLNHLNALKRFSRYLTDCHNYSLDSSIKVTAGTPVKRKWLSPKEVKALYDSCDFTAEGITNRAILSVYYGLGLRRSEGTALDINDIDNPFGVAYVRKGKFSKERYVPITDLVYSDIEKYISNVRNKKIHKNQNNEEQALLLSENGKRFSGSAIYERLQLVAKKAGISTPLPLHSLRHSIATHLLQAGMSLESIGSFLGHSSLESTQIYTHLIKTSSPNEKLL
jgi:integrase/recombinase XerD